MYAIIRNGKGGYYTSVVFGYDCPVSARSRRKRERERIYNQFYVVLSEDKKRLVKRWVFPRNKRRFDPLVLITDQEDAGWVMDQDGHGCAAFLAGIDFASQGEIIDLPPELLEQCIRMDAEYACREYREVRTEADLRNLYCVAGGFHDAYIELCQRRDDQIYLLLDGLWGCRLELWFEGEAACSAKVWDCQEDPIWFAAALVKLDGFYCLVDEATADVGTLDDSCRWLKAKGLRYHVIPNP